jgi:23S rRNA (adenine1618-N6)-methyltransferase
MLRGSYSPHFAEIMPTECLLTAFSIDFVMMNPPFYASEAEMLESAKTKQRPPNSACTGAAVEMICPGGEVAFVKRLIEQSAEPEAKEKVQWFTSMLGKLASVGLVVEALKEKGCANWAVAEFVQGQKTRRWAVGWSWEDRRPSVAVARGAEGPGVEKKWLPFPSEFTFEVRVEGEGMEEVGGRISQEVESLDMKWQWKRAIAQGLGMAERDVWSRKARRRKKGGVEGEEMDEDTEAALIFKISLSQGHGGSGVLVAMRWLQGRDSVLFESFCGWLKRRVESR